MKKISLALLVVISTFACKKDNVQKLEYDTQTAQDNSLADAIFNDVNNIANEAMESGSLSTYKLSSANPSVLSSCATLDVTPDSTGIGGTIMVNFGSTSCLCLDGRYRSGIITIYYTGAYRDSGTQIMITFNNYYVGLDATRMFKVGNSKTITNRGRNAAGHLYYTISVDGNITNYVGAHMNWQSTRQREWIAGDTSLAWVDDRYLITGTATGSNFEGNGFTVTITNPLLVALNCPYIESGTFELTPTGSTTRTFDYGAGSCDNSATLTISGRTFPITLR